MVVQRRTRRRVPALRGTVMAAALAGTLTGCWTVEDEITLSEHGGAFSVGYADVDEDWQLIVGGTPDSELGMDMWEMLADVEATNTSDKAREVLLEFVFSQGGDEVVTATCVSLADDVAPGDSVPLGCVGPKQVTPNDFDQIKVRALS